MEKKFKLSELGTFKNGANYPKGSYGIGDKIVNVKDLFKGRFVKEEYLDELKPDALKNKEIYLVEDGDILFTRSSLVRSGAGMCAMIKNPTRDILFCGFIIRYRVNKKKVYPLYLLYLLRSPQYRKLFTGAQQTNITNINQDTLGDIDIYLPVDENGNIDIEKQKETVEILNKIDLKIENNINKICELEKMAKTIYDYCFLQFDFPDKNGNPYKSSGGKMEWNEELKKEIPEGWKIKRVSDILNVITGKKDANFATENGKYNFFTCANDISKCDEYEFQGKSVLIAGNGDFNVKYFDGKFNAYQRTYVLIPKEEKYIGLIYQSAIRKIDSFKRGSNGSIVKFITKGDIDNIEILIPDDDKLINVLNTNLDMVQHLKNEIEELVSVRDFLLPLLMNGQVSFE